MMSQSEEGDIFILSCATRTNQSGVCDDNGVNVRESVPLTKEDTESSDINSVGLISNQESLDLDADDEEEEPEEGDYEEVVCTYDDGCSNQLDIESGIHDNDDNNDEGDDDDDDSDQEQLKDNGLSNEENVFSEIQTSAHLTDKLISGSNTNLEKGLKSSAAYDFRIKKRSALDWIHIGNQVLVQWSDGLYYEGVILEVDSIDKRCLVEYEDKSEHWSPFRDLHKQIERDSNMSDMESDILCVICGDGTSKVTNEIVLCDCCNHGYHQLCHRPKIPNSLLKTDDEWNCRKCVFFLTAKPGGAEKKGSMAKAMRSMKTVFPYDLNSLNWDSKHVVNEENIYCYCGGPGEYHTKMLQCSKCTQWFHEACIQVLTGPLLFGDHYYSFTCAVCNDGKETVKRIIMKWSDLVGLVLYNLGINDERTYFRVKTDMVPFIQKHCTQHKLNVDLNQMKPKELVEQIEKILDNFKTTKFKSSHDSKGNLVWGLRLLSKIHLIFAPPHALTCSSSSPNLAQLQPATLPSGAAMMSFSPPKSLPLPMGACRKGASIFPLKPKKPGSISSGSSVGSSASTCGRKPKGYFPRKNICSPTRMNAKSTASSATSECSDVEYSSASIFLDCFIPRPPDYEGKNNPFSDLDEKAAMIQTNKSNKRQNTGAGYRVITNTGNSSKLTIQRISSLKKARSSTTDAEFDSKDVVACLPEIEERLAKGEKYTIKGRRITLDGRVEYLFVWETPPE